MEPPLWDLRIQMVLKCTRTLQFGISQKKIDGKAHKMFATSVSLGGRLEHCMWTCRNLNRHLNFSVLSLLFLLEGSSYDGKMEDLGRLTGRAGESLGLFGLSKPWPCQVPGACRYPTAMGSFGSLVGLLGCCNLALVKVITTYNHNKTRIYCNATIVIQSDFNGSSKAIWRLENDWHDCTSL